MTVISLIKESSLRGMNFLVNFDSIFPEFLFEEPVPEEDECADGAHGF